MPYTKLIESQQVTWCSISLSLNVANVVQLSKYSAYNMKW